MNWLFFRFFPFLFSLTKITQISSSVCYNRSVVVSPFLAVVGPVVCKADAVSASACRSLWVSSLSLVWWLWSLSLWVHSLLTSLPNTPLFVTAIESHSQMLLPSGDQDWEGCHCTDYRIWNSVPNIYWLYCYFYVQRQRKPQWAVPNIPVKTTTNIRFNEHLPLSLPHFFPSTPQL